MTARPLTSTEDLFVYLIALADEISAQKEHGAAEALRQASRFASGSPSEFLHEAQVALRAVKTHHAAKLTKTQIENIDAAVDQIESAFFDVGGA